MTDDELRRKLGNKLGWDGSTGYPPLSELVATGEGRLTESQQVSYASAVIREVDPFWDHNEDLCACFRLITAPAAVRAMALLEVLE